MKKVPALIRILKSCRTPKKQMQIVEGVEVWEGGHRFLSTLQQSTGIKV